MKYIVKWVQDKYAYCVGYIDENGVFIIVESHKMEDIARQAAERLNGTDIRASKPQQV